MLYLHISDIHFKRKEVGTPDDPNQALRNDMIEDVKHMREKIGRAADGILISGDIAYHGVEEEYNFAYDWLEKKLCPVAGCKIQDVFVVPGNHDIDRSKEAGPAQVAARNSLRTIDAREVDKVVREWLSLCADALLFIIQCYLSVCLAPAGPRNGSNNQKKPQ
ncbi:MAG: metallophosphoesterase [Pseudomonadota bacterium]